MSSTPSILSKWSKRPSGFVDVATEVPSHLKPLKYSIEKPCSPFSVVRILRAIGLLVLSETVPGS